MLLIPCPYCGPRDEHEFTCGGDAHVVRPGPPETVSDATWADYLFASANPRGSHRERWLHAFGCGQWFNIVRDTYTHTITSSYAMGTPGPGGVA